MAKNRERWIEEWTKVVLQGQSPEAVRRARR
jgi:thiamine transport system substrate-binding protein